MKTWLLFIALAFSTLSLSSCFEAGLLIEDASVASVAEDAAWNAVARRAVLTASEEEILTQAEIETWGRKLSSNELLYKMENDVKAVFTNGENPKLYLTENNQQFAEVLNRNTLRLTKGGEIRLKENISSIKSSDVNVRNLPRLDNSTVIDNLKNQNGRLVLVLDESQSSDGITWYRVYMSDIKRSGWINGRLLFPILISDSSVYKSSKINSQTQTGQSRVKVDSTTRRLREIRIISLNGIQNDVQELKRIIAGSLKVDSITQELNVVPQKSADRLNPGVTIRYFSNTDQSQALEIESLISSSGTLNNMPVKIENMLPHFNNKPINKYLEIWLK